MDRLNLLSDLIEKAKKLGASDVDAIIVDSSDLYTEVRLGKPTNIQYSQDASIGFRVLINQQQAMTSTADFSKESLDQMLARAIAMAKVTPANPHLFIADKDQLTKEFKDLNLYDNTELSSENLLERAKHAEDIAMQNNKIVNSEGSSSGISKNKIYFATSNGFSHAYQTSSSSVSLSVLAGKDEDMQTGYDYSVARFISDLKSPEELGKEAAKRTIEKLFPRKISTAQIPVIFESRIARRLLGDFAASINGSSISRGTSFLIDHLGKEIFNPEISIIDDPFIIKGLGSRPFDGEAISTSKLDIVKDGILNHYLLDLQTAHKLKMQTNGRAIRGLSSAPSPASSNMYILAGEQSVEDMIKNTKKGLFVTEVFGHGGNIITGDYSQGAVGFYIEDGVLTYPVSEITIAGNLKDMFKQMVPASDLKFESSINSPSLLIKKMTIAGA